MAVTVFFTDGRIQEFLAATAAQNHHDGRFYVGRHDEATGVVNLIATFASADVAVAQIFEHGTLKDVIVSDRTLE